MQTPSDLEIDPPDPNDFPYAGLLFWEVRLHFIGERVAYEPSLVLGIVGEWSGAEQSQKLIHKVTGSTKPEGWEHQLENEPVINVGHYTRWLAFANTSDYGLDWDVVPAAGINAGNLSSYIETGVSFRFGKGLEHSWPVAGVLSDREADPLAGNHPGAWYVSIGAGAQYVFNSIFVQGNTWDSGPGLDLKHEQFYYGAALSYSFGDISLILNLATRSERAQESDGDEEFGSLSIAWAID